MARYIATLAVRVDATDDSDARDLIDRVSKQLIDSEWVDALVVADPVRITPDDPDPTDPDSLPPTAAAALLPFPLAFGGLPIADQRWVGLALLGAFVVAVLLVIAVSWWRNRHAPFPPATPPTQAKSHPFKDWTVEDEFEKWRHR